MTQITIETIKRDLTAFKGTDGVWYGSTGKGKTIGGLADGMKGATVELVGYKQNGNYHNVASIKTIGAAPAKAAGNAGGNNRDEVIVRQNALTNASNLIAAGVFKAKSPADVIALMEELAAGVLKKSPEAAAPKKAAPKKKAEPVEEEEVEDMDDSEDCPFEL